MQTRTLSKGKNVTFLFVNLKLLFPLPPTLKKIYLVKAQEKSIFGVFGVDKSENYGIFVKDF